MQGEIEEGRTKALKYKMMKIEGLRLKPPVCSASGLPSVDVVSLQTLAGNPAKGKYGEADTHFE